MAIQYKSFKVMKSLFQKIILMSGASLASILVFTFPGNASVFYDLEFFNNNGELVGTGEFSHEDEPFDETIDLCLIESSCGSILFEIQKEDNFFRVESFSSTRPFLQLLSGLVERDEIDLFWRPFDDELVASIFHTPGCASPTCSGRLFFADDSWSFSIRAVGSARITATEWEVSSAIEVADGTWTATHRTTIPEPASTLGLMAIGALGVGSKLKRS